MQGGGQPIEADNDGFASRAFTYDAVIPTAGEHLSLLAQAIESVERQTVPPRRILVIVDGNANAAEVVSERHPRVEVVLQPKLGVAAARQHGVELATSTWIAFLDDDDLWLPWKQARTAQYLAGHPDCRALRAGFWMFAAPDDPAEGLNGHRVELRASSLDEFISALGSASPRNDMEYLDIEGDSLGLLLQFNRGVIGTTVVERKLAQGLPPVPRGTVAADDWLFFLEVAKRAEWHLVRARLLGYRVHSGQATQRKGIEGPRAILAAKKYAWESMGANVPHPLVSYGQWYRSEIRQLAWARVRNGRPWEGLVLLAEGAPLLPRWQDRFMASVPEPMVWRADALLRRVGRSRASHSGGACQAPPQW